MMLHEQLERATIVVAVVDGEFVVLKDRHGPCGPDLFSLVIMRLRDAEKADQRRKN